jgi:hypothetical protein
MSVPSVEIGLAGGLLRLIEGAAAAAPTLVVGLAIAAIFRFYLGPDGTRKLFGGESLRSLPQSWAVGMLLPVCSIGVIPILAEMHRARVRPGALSAFALSAPLFNPLSLLYGLTLARPMIVLFFAFGSLLVVTIVGAVWDAAARRRGREPESDGGPVGSSIVGIRRLSAVALMMTRSLCGSTGAWALVALAGLLLLSMVLPFGAMQESVERDDWTAPATMTAVAIPAYATPMLAMTQLGMMFQHANSPGAAFVLLVLGTGMNLATLLWLGRRFGARSVTLWFSCLLVIVVGIAYAVNGPLVPPGVEPAGHTHAFDIYTNPLQPSDTVSVSLLWQKLTASIELWERISLGLIAALLTVGAIARGLGWNEQRLRVATPPADATAEDGAASPRGFDRNVPPQVVGATMLLGLIAVSVAMCYSYYPSPTDALEEIAVIRAECLSAANSGNVEHATYHLQLWDDWSRRLEVGTFLRHGRVRPYQRMQGYLLRKKLELLEHELEHDPFELEETRKVVREVLETSRRWSASFRPSKA